MELGSSVGRTLLKKSPASKDSGPARSSPASKPTTESGRPPDSAIRSRVERSTGADLSDVRVHDGPDAWDRTRDFNALAVTMGEDIYFSQGRNAPGSREGGSLLAHELAHVVQQRNAGRNTGGLDQGRSDPTEQHARSVANAALLGVSSPALPASSPVPAVQRAIDPEDVSSEMVGREFEVSRAFSSGSVKVNAGDKVKVVSWDNALPTVRVETIAKPGTTATAFDIPKTALRPTSPTASKIHKYSAGVGQQAKSVEAQEQKIADWAAVKSKYKRNPAAWAAQNRQLETLRESRTKVLNRKLIQETMFNRFDPIIEREVNAANAAHGYKGSRALDPNLVKSMLFEESQLGTSGKHLEVPPSTEEKSRFNLGQMIDSSGIALLTMLEREQPTLITKHKLGSLRADLSAAQIERDKLKKTKSPSTTDKARLKELDRLATQSWEIFIWDYRQAGSATGFEDAVREFYGSGTPAKNLDYEFWIHMAVLWLFEKRKNVSSWKEAIRAYNGSGKRAEHYRDAVSKRATGAATAAKGSRDFEPDRI